MGQLAGFRYRDIVKRLKALGLEFHRQAAGSHEIWINPALNRYTKFDLPRRGTEVRFISLDESRGQLEVLIPIYRTGQMGILTVRSEADMAAAKRAAQ